MAGQVSHEVEVNVPANDAWDLFGTLQLAKFLEKELSHVILRIDVLEGDGGVGSVLKLTFPPDTPGFAWSKEKFLKIDNEKGVKETEIIEGGYQDLGFTFYRTRFEVIEKGADSCIIKITIEYDIKGEEAAANASIVSIEPLANIVEIVKKYLIKNKT